MQNFYIYYLNLKMESMMILKMRVPELRNRCSELGLDTNRLKAELIDRINKHLDRLLVERLKKID